MLLPKNAHHRLTQSFIFPGCTNTFPTNLLRKYYFFLGVHLKEEKMLLHLNITNAMLPVFFCVCHFFCLPLMVALFPSWKEKCFVFSLFRYFPMTLTKNYGIFLIMWKMIMMMFFNVLILWGGGGRSGKCSSSNMHVSEKQKKKKKKKNKQINKIKYLLLLHVCYFFLSLLVLFVAAIVLDRLLFHEEKLVSALW